VEKVSILHGEAFSDKLIAFELIVKKTSNYVQLFFVIGVLRVPCASNLSHLLTLYLPEGGSGALEGLEHFEELKEVNDTVLVAVELCENISCHLRGDVTAAHVFEHFTELFAAHMTILVGVVVLEVSH